MKSQDELMAIENGMARSILQTLLNGTDMPAADLLDAIRRGVEDGVFRALIAVSMAVEQAGTEP